MRAGGGKAKGSQFERDVCGALSRWVSHGERDDLFWRSAMSGGRATVGRRKGKELREHAGDISATHSDGHKLTDRWYIECKRYALLDIEAAILNGVGRLAKFWREACAQATAHGKMPMMIVRQDRTQTLLIVPTSQLLTPYGTSPFWPQARLFTAYRLEFTAFDFDTVMQTEFEPAPSHVNLPMLKPGELARILAGDKPQPKKEPSRKRVRIERVRI